jgi:hypothetical protein
MNSDVAIAVVTVSGTILISVLGLIISRYFQQKREQDVAHRDKKTEMYDAYLKKLFDLFAFGDKKHTGNPEELTLFLRDFQRKLILWANPDTIKSYAEWYKELSTPPQRVKAIIKIIDFFLSIRKDLGHSNKGVKREQIARLFLRNPELAIREYERNPQITMEELSEIEKKTIATQN